MQGKTCELLFSQRNSWVKKKGEKLCGCCASCYLSGELIAGIYSNEEKLNAAYLEYCKSFADHPESDPNGLIAKAIMAGAVPFESFHIR